MISDPVNTQTGSVCTGRSFRILQSFSEIAVPCKEMMVQYLERNYFERGEGRNNDRDYLDDRKLHVFFFQKQLICLEAQEPQKKLLEVGGAGGFLVEAADRHGEFCGGGMQAAARNPLDKK